MALATIKQNFPLGCPRYPPAVQRPRKIKKSNVYWMLLKYFWKKMGLQVSFWKCVLSGWLCWNGGLPSGSHGIMAAILVVHWWTLTQLLHTSSHWPSHHIIVTVGLFAIFQLRVRLQWLGSRSSFFLQLYDRVPLMHQMFVIAETATRPQKINNMLLVLARSEKRSYFKCVLNFYWATSSSFFHVGLKYYNFPTQRSWENHNFLWNILP